MGDDRRRYERIDIDLPCRLFIRAAGAKNHELTFEAFTRSGNLSLGGVFIPSTFLIKPGVELFVELGLPDGLLEIRGRVCRAAEGGERGNGAESGLGVEFLDVDSHGRETLLRYFTPARYHEFHLALRREFPHLERDFEIRDVSLVLNLWEEWRTESRDEVLRFPVPASVPLRADRPPAVATRGAPERAPAPAQARPQAPAQNRPQAPAQNRPQAPGQNRPQAPAQARPQAPAQARPQAPAQARPQAPAQARPPAPAQARPPAPISRPATPAAPKGARAPAGKNAAPGRGGGRR